MARPKKNAEIDAVDAVDESPEVADVEVAVMAVPVEDAAAVLGAYNAAARCASCSVVDVSGNVVTFKSYGSTVDIDVAGLEMSQIAEKLKQAGF